MGVGGACALRRRQNHLQGPAGNGRGHFISGARPPSQHRRGRMTTLSGVWLPIVTPFRDGAIDFASYERLLDHYLGLGVRGIFPLSTTGEGPALDDDEAEAIVERT